MTFLEMQVFTSSENKAEILKTLTDAGMREDLANDVVKYATIGFIASCTCTEQQAQEIEASHRKLDELGVPRGEIHDGGFSEDGLEYRLTYVLPNKDMKRYDGGDWGNG